MGIGRWFATVAAAAIVCSPLVFVSSAAAQAIPEPAADPFYSAHADLATRPNGAILRSRPIAPLGINMRAAIEAWQVQYKSVDAANRPTTGLATVLVPTAPWTGPGTRPLVSYQVAEDSLGTRCAPSYWLRAGAQAPPMANSVEVGLVSLIVQRNWAVVVSDYQGPQSRFLDGRQTAHSVLDGVRAATAFPPARLGKDTQVGLAGYSGGAFASLWAEEQRRAYAPEVRIAGVAAGGVLADISGTAAKVNRTQNAGLALLFLQALDRVHPDANIGKILNDKGRGAFAQNQNSCGLEIVGRSSNIDLNDYTTVRDPWASPAFTKAAKPEELGSKAPTAPAFIWHATQDEMLPVAATDALVRSYCQRGSQVTYRHTGDPQHFLALTPGLLPGLDYLGDRFAGRPLAAGCDIR